MKRERRKLERTDLKMMNLPADHWMAMFDKIQAKMKPPVLNFINKLDDAFNRGVGLFLIGAKGVGKTSIAAVIGKESRARGYTVFFTSVWQLREDIRDHVDYNDTESVLDRCRNVDLLILDNLRPEDAEEKFYLSMRSIEEILTQRRGQRRPTIITSQMAIGDIGKLMRGLRDATEGSLLLLPVEGVNMRVDEAVKLSNEFLGGK